MCATAMYTTGFSVCGFHGLLYSDPAPGKPLAQVAVFRGGRPKKPVWTCGASSSSAIALGLETMHEFGGKKARSVPFACGNVIDASVHTRAVYSPRAHIALPHLPGTDITLAHSLHTHSTLAHSPHTHITLLHLPHTHTTLPHLLK